MEYHIKNLPYTATYRDIVQALEAISGTGSVLSCNIKAEATGRSKGFGFFTVRDEATGDVLLNVSRSSGVFISGRRVVINYTNRVRHKPKHHESVLNGITVYMGNLASNSHLEYLWSADATTKIKYQDRDDDVPELRLEMDMPDELENLLGNGNTYKLEYTFASFVEVKSCTVFGNKGILFQLSYPPRVYVRALLDFSLLNFSNERLWNRTTDFTDAKAIGQSMAFCLSFGPDARNEPSIVFKKFNDYSLGDYPPNFRTAIKLSRSYEVHTVQQELGPLIRTSCLPQDILFKVNYLVQYGYISPTGLSSDFYNLLSRNPVEVTLAALGRFESFKTICCDPAAKLRNFIRSRKRPQHAGPIQLEEGQVYMKRLMVTPTKVYCLGPEIEVSNRITRNFSGKINQFMRVTFAEEDFDNLNSTALTTSRILKSSIYHRFMSVLENGVELGNMKFEFLAFSASQLRENSVWMFSSDLETTAEKIRNWMGVFQNIRNVAKCAARMGQSFSSSTHTLNVSQREAQNISDIKLDKYCFSDGIGKISREFAVLVARKCPSLKTVPSAFQIRYGGYKGVVAVDPNISSKLQLRPSMLKFPSEQTGLDVISWTKSIPCYLNRQVIILLSTLGIPDTPFEQLQTTVVRRLDNMLTDAATALDVLRTVHSGESHKVIAEMLRAGYSPDREPYLSSLLRAFRASQLFLLRTKSRILVPKGRCLMGCLDETATLSYGQCFVQVSWSPEAADPNAMPVRRRFHNFAGVRQGDTAFVVQGLVVVAKNPCLHPGDVIVLEAVDVPQLHHMVDCIVFPQKGLRPHPNECSGSDLDGDLYFVSWDTSLIPTCRYPAMDYEAATSADLDHPVTLKEICNFFLNHMINNSLGVISNAHLVHADSSPTKACDPKCIDLAKLFSIAVDFPKTGVPAIIPMELRPVEYPDFLEKSDKPSYESSTILGKLYRSIKNLDAEGAKRSHLNHDEEFDPGLLVEGREKYIEDAVYHKSNYDGKLTGLLNHYNLSEAEIMCGSISSLSRFYKKRQGDAKERILLAAKALIKEAKGWFEEDCSNDGLDSDELARASAWYYVTYAPDYRRGVNPQEELLSFPWVLYDRLIEIKRMA